MISDPTLGALCALGAALAWSVTSLLARSLLAHYGSVTINAVRSGVAGLLLVVCVSVTAGPGALVAMSGTTFGLLAVSIVAAIAVGDTVFFESTRAIGLVQLGFALMVPVGAGAFLITKGFINEERVGQLTGAALAFSAGTFIFIALSDLLPEVQFHRHDRIPLFLALLAGIALMGAIALLEPHGKKEKPEGDKKEDEPAAFMLPSRHAGVNE